MLVSPGINPSADGSLRRGDPVTSGPGDPLPQRYEICVRGRVRKTMRLAFPGLQAEARSGDTVLTGALADSAALYGVLAERESLGLELLEVRLLPRC